ncbi:MAG: 2,3,4,5-tetrahydropyridine-2,6-dicarboxylate N-succinyltransferase [Solirubrobacteraceae bacterium]|nr:2,3,4,5-tetrahydropyridine-2,6-dicarboxylate N-succinyltransferase [Solirubrobacteraceae bacterium]
MITRVNSLRHRARFAAWVALLRVQLRRRGATLVVDAPHGARLDGFPHVRVEALGDGDATFVLRLGRGVSLGRATHLDVWAGGANELSLGDGAYLMHGVRLQLRSGTIALGAHAHVRDGAVLKSAGELRIGREVTISFGDVLACTERIEIGDLVGLGERVTITDSDHTHDGSAGNHYLAQPLRVTPVRLGRNVLVSANAVVLRGADIGDGAVVAAGALVGSGGHPGGLLLAGAPATPVKRVQA